MERANGYYWVRLYPLDDNIDATWDVIDFYRHVADGRSIVEYIMLSGTAETFGISDVLEWGPRIYPPDHVFKDAKEPFDYDERLIPDVPDYQAKH